MVKAIVEEGSRKILGCTVVGPEASSLIQQIVYLVNTDRQDMMPMIISQVIHPTLSEVLIKAFSMMVPVDQKVAEGVAEGSKILD